MVHPPKKTMRPGQYSQPIENWQRNSYPPSCFVFDVDAPLFAIDFRQTRGWGVQKVKVETDKHAMMMPTLPRTRPKEQPHSSGSGGEGVTTRSFGARRGRAPGALTQMVPDQRNADRLESTRVTQVGSACANLKRPTSIRPILRLFFPLLARSNPSLSARVLGSRLWSVHPAAAVVRGRFD